MKIKFIGHAAALIETDSKILIDPFISGNPICSENPDDFTPDAIILTHGHADHIGDTVDIATRTGCVVYAMAELSRWLGTQGVKVHGFNTGGSFLIGDTKVTSVEAIHSSSCPDGSYGGLACGFIIEHEDHTFYHAGDTALYSGMQLLGSTYKIDVAMLPIGGNYTMDAKAASLAARMLSPAFCIPIHYNTFPLIKCDPAVFCEYLYGSGIECNILALGETFSL